MEIRAVRGMNDILPEDAPAWRFVEETARRIFSLYGFEELRPPILERTELFLRGMGDETDVVEKQMYTFTDKGGDSVTLRPEATACVLRAVIEHGLLAKDSTVKLYTIGPMFRYERPQKGRYRQFHQINAERLGEDTPLADAETLALAHDLVDSVLDDPTVRLEVNSLGCKACRPLFTRALKDFLASREGVLCEDCRRRMRTNPLRVLDCKVPSCRDAVQGAPFVEDSLCDACLAHHERVLACLDALGIRYAKNPRLVRGLDYYTRTTFEVVSEKLGALSAVAGGGRYDDLLAILGGPAAGGIGFAIGMERLIMLASRRPERPPACFVVAQNNPEVEMAALALMREIRSAGIGADSSLGRSFKAQMRRADRLGCPVCLILGEDEIAKGVVTIRDMARARQEAVPRTDITARVADMLARDKGDQR